MDQLKKLSRDIETNPSEPFPPHGNSGKPAFPQTGERDSDFLSSGPDREGVIGQPPPLSPKAEVIPLSVGTPPKPQADREPADEEGLPPKRSAVSRTSLWAVGAGVLVLIVLGVMGHQISQNEKRIGEAFQGMKEARDQIGLLQGAVTENSDAIAAARAGLTTLTGQFEELSTRLDRQKILKWKSQLNQQAAVLEELGKLQNPEVQTRFGQVSDGLKVLSSTL